MKHNPMNQIQSETVTAPEMRPIFRVQDSDGRGPWKPGFSNRWLDADIGLRANLPPWPMEFGMKLMRRVKPGQHVGCGCVSLDQLWKWFTRAEMDRLHIFGYHLIEIPDGQILAESDVQCVFVRDCPLAEGVKVIE